jgi:TorA maturation chaperone TorD
MQSWVGTMCDDYCASAGSFYASLAQLAKVFFDVEMQSFDME